ncbi:MULTISPECIES: hypothetical protein [Acinetobacter]|jgi:hypothetical protein|uniref:Uncharacterized protein n=1 Tax=Acinetobacter parvus DSM 16617 = CIP 108168 TaxID=981333 RepID=N8RQ65_9GAMM|nr:MULTISPECIES: hypothetical protein [Acinetobacter]ENU37513.1 hypothetical protein F988_00316 [Acinetobacter parvus DSM 16617 = CIP 108168]ENU84226.1 hypothetical protein F974_00733 [Acinetobacter sp. CIP 102159]ENU90427.1 hypothetical protein F972_00158 [Acinetobacter sp. CIP 102529]ENX66475.1 hypothetical protein F884_00848 [Acinetobacter sp. CIP 102143]MCU4392679.1 hypothetical protein [Acinetobacter parvus]
MRRFLFLLGLVVICIGSFLLYQHQLQQRAADSKQMFEVVMAEKMRELYDQAQDWSKPIQLNVHDDRLSGDYKLMSEFLLSYWMQNVEARNAYLRQLKAANWDTFLDVERLDQDRQKGYRETEKMLHDVRKISTEYGINRQKIQADSLEQAKNLAIHNEMRKSLQEKLQNNLKTDKEHDIFPIEQQVIEKAQAMFDMLKTYPWQREDNKILFKETAQVKKFNALYQDVLSLNQKMDKIKQNNVEVLDQEL